MINVEQLVTTSFPEDGILRKYFSKPVIGLLRTLLREQEFVDFEKRHPGISGFDFIDEALSYFDFTYQTNQQELERIPTEGKVVLVANHPIGSLDGLALLQMLHKIRPDVKIVANQLLSKLGPLAPTLLTVDNMGGNTAKLQLKAIKKHLLQEGAVIVFPSGVVSRWGREGIKDEDWRNGFLKFSKATRAPILPVYVEGRNSTFFYILSIIARKISTLWLVPEMFKQRGKRIRFHIGKIIPCKGYESLELARKSCWNALNSKSTGWPVIASHCFLLTKPSHLRKTANNSLKRSKAVSSLVKPGMASTSTCLNTKLTLW